MPFTYTYGISQVVKIVEMNEGGNKTGLDSWRKSRSYQKKRITQNHEIQREENFQQAEVLNAAGKWMQKGTEKRPDHQEVIDSLWECSIHSLGRCGDLGRLTVRKRVWGGRRAKSGSYRWCLQEDCRSEEARWKRLNTLEQVKGQFL